MNKAQGQRANEFFWNAAYANKISVNDKVYVLTEVEE